MRGSLLPLVLCCLFLATFWPTAGVQGFAGKLDSNPATASQLEQLPSIGENTYRAIAPYLSLTDDTCRPRNRTATSGAVRDDSSPSHITMHQPGRFPVHDKELLLLLDKKYYPTLLSALENAQSEITIAMFLFKTTHSAKNRPAKVLAALAAARKRGVRVEVVLEKSSYDDKLNRENKKAARLLKNKGIRVRFDRGRVTTHTKLVIIDRRYSFIGSHNLTEAALDYNHEASLLIDNRELAEKLLRYIQGL